jgi:hypothetical protein
MKNQEWIFLASSNKDKWVIQSRKRDGQDNIRCMGSEGKPVIFSTVSQDSVCKVVDNSDDTISLTMNSKVKVGDKETVEERLISCDNSGVLNLDVKPNRRYKDIPSSAKWRLIALSPVVAEMDHRAKRGEAKRYQYRLRSLNGSVLNWNGSALQALQYTASHENTSLWNVDADPKPEGNDGLADIRSVQYNTYLTFNTAKADNPSGYQITMGGIRGWRIESVGGFAYQILHRSLDDDYALTLNSDMTITLKRNKVGHGQLWLVERNFA